MTTVLIARAGLWHALPMFISVKRHEREKQEFIAAGNRLTDALLKCTAQGFFLLNAKGRVLPPVSSAMTTLFQCKDFSNLSFEKLLAPLVSVKALTAARGFLAELLSAESTPPSTAAAELSGDGTMRYEIDVRLAKPDGSSDALHYSFEFDPVDTGESRTWLVRVTDNTLHIQTVRDLTDLRLQFQTQREILRAILQKGETRFSGFLVKADASMKTIAAVMKKPSREDAAFRQKLDQMLDEVDRIRREAAAFHFSALENAARSFEDALHELRKRAAMSGSDFLPLTVKSDQLYNAFDLIKSVAAAAGPIRDSEGSLPAPSMTTGGTLIIEAPKFSSESAVPAPSAAERPVSAGSLDGALLALTEHVAHEHNKQVVLESTGLHLVPPGFQAAIKNIAIQLIRNAVMHGIETPASRLAAGKPPTGLLRLEFRPRAENYELLFEDDGCGLVPEDVRATAVARGIITAAAAERMRDREAIKLIFRSRYTTLGKDADGARHGNGMSLVRRYVHDAGGKIALASLAGYETRFKITLPAAAPPAEFPEAEARVA